MPLPKSLERAWFSASDLIWPRFCLVCEAAQSEPAEVCICPACVSVITTDPHLTCPRCSSTVGPHADVSEGCARCRNEKYRFGSVTRLATYDGKVRDTILDIKRPGGDALAEALGTLFATFRRERLMASAPHVIVPVPLHWSRWWIRRHNQAEAIARGISEVLGVPMRRAIRRVQATPKQASVTAVERRKNLVGAFRSTSFPSVRGLRVLLVDDVLTTGATADAATEAVLAAGAAQVHVAVLAHR